MMNQLLSKIDVNSSTKGYTKFPCKLGCGIRYKNTKYLSHLREYHPEKFIEHQRNAVNHNHNIESRRLVGKQLASKLVSCKLGCNHKYITKNYFRHLKEYHFDMFISNQKKAGKCRAKQGGGQVLVDYIKLYPEHQSKAGKQAHIKRPEIFIENGRKLGRKYISVAHLFLSNHPEIMIERGRRLGNRMVETGQIWELLNRKPNVVYHQSSDLLHFHESKKELLKCDSCKTNKHHFHRSKSEREYCIKLHSEYPKNWIHTNICLFARNLGGVEIDFVISPLEKFNSTDPSTWSKIIEYHPIRHWQGETLESYTNNRTSKLRSLEVTCPIEVVCV